MARIYRGWKPPRKPSNKPKALPGRRVSRNPGLASFSIYFKGGPLQGQSMTMRLDGGTLPISMRGQTGWYAGDGAWNALA